MFDIKALLIVTLIVFNVFSVKYKSDLKTNVYFCIQDKEVIYFSKKRPKHLLGDKCFVKEYTNEQYYKYKKYFN